MTRHDEVLVLIRRIIRAADLRSKQLGKETGLTAPQLLILRSIGDSRNTTMSQVAQNISLSQATVTSIVDRLEKKSLVARIRDSVDKRRIYLVLTDEGKEVLAGAPRPLQELFTSRFDNLPEWEQYLILASLAKVADMMDATDIDASPLLAVGSVT
ncbi:MarR family transcriptional regulator [Hahella aquimaris]|uniref:Transcriptional regulator n=1 Tax=Hahella chejuensis (strain KCTC 2396) TaxID=349521 RepID=Q2SLG6_HAHCH|nr:MULTISPECIES: MarR family transcriptional regulator [Hahella]ABC28508.1 Transcriptional regulator [Hahella chejuensis KCTC 2396]WLQ11630.1 MarR family transcriptional regulator [Hahella sp. HNIBRBA332]